MGNRLKMTIAQAPFDGMAATSSSALPTASISTFTKPCWPSHHHMFSLPQTTRASKQTARQSAPVVDVAEDSQMLDQILHLCYLITDPAIKELMAVEDALEAAMKYQMEGALAIIRALLCTFGPGEPQGICHCVSLAARG